MLVFEAIVLLTLPVVALRLVSKRRHSHVAGQDFDWVPLGAVVFAMVVLLAQYAQRLIGLGDSTEVVCLSVLQNVGWYMIIFSGLVPRYRKFGFVISCVLVLFICFASETFSVFVASFFFSILALWHLLSNYWSKLDGKALDGQAKMLPVSSFAIAASFLIIISTGMIVWSVVPQNPAINLEGFSAFSGGNEGDQDHFARAGVGDGDMLSAGLNASTTGPVASDQFIEDTKPSMYDVNVERNAPATEIKKIKKRRAVAISAKMKHLEKIVQSEQAGQTFRTSRKQPSDKVLDLENRISKALFFVEGSVPVRFSIDSFQYFDGWDWSKGEISETDLAANKIRPVSRLGTPWFQNSLLDKSYVTSSRAHRVKILRLKTDAVPAPPLHRAWHIDQVNAPTIFKVNAQGGLCMAMQAIPSQTVIDNISDVPNFYLLGKNITKRRPTTESAFSQIPENDSKDRIIQLAKDWTDGFPEGWRQVESIINHLRRDFIHDPYLVATEEHSDSIASFLDQRGGPAYQFASAATQILRAAGYDTRLQRGFLVQAKDYNRLARQSVVTSENLHMWPEVRLDGSHWIPVEPTPGYPIPYNDLSWWQWCKVQAGLCILEIKKHPLASLSIALLIGCLIRFRLDLIAGLCWIVWAVVLRLAPSQQLTATRRLIDLRCWAAGFPRPSFVTAPDWFSQLDPQATKQFGHFWQVENFCFEKGNFLQQNNVARACRQIAAGLSFYRIKSHTQSKAKK